MSHLSREDVLKLARLAKLELTEDELEQFTRELPAILEYVEQLQSADTKGLEPTYQVSGQKNVMRDDEVIAYSATPEDLLKNVPEVKDNQIKVKKIL